MALELLHLGNRQLRSNSKRKKSVSTRRDIHVKIVMAKFLQQNAVKSMYVVALHCWRCTGGQPSNTTLAISQLFLPELLFTRLTATSTATLSLHQLLSCTCSRRRPVTCGNIRHINSLPPISSTATSSDSFDMWQRHPPPPEPQPSSSTSSVYDQQQLVTTPRKDDGVTVMRSGRVGRPLTRMTSHKCFLAFAVPSFLRTSFVCGLSEYNGTRSPLTVYSGDVHASFFSLCPSLLFP